MGFNLPFDLTRIALSASKARGRKRNSTYVGGHSLRLWENETYRPRISYKAIDSKRTLMGFTTANRATDPFRGTFSICGPSALPLPTAATAWSRRVLPSGFPRPSGRLPTAPSPRTT